MGGIIVSTDPPDHERIRKVLHPKLLASALKATAERIDALVSDTVDRLLQEMTFDAVTDLAQVIPVTIVADLLGLSEPGRAALLPGAHAMFDANGPADRLSSTQFAEMDALVNFAHSTYQDRRFARDTIGRTIVDAVDTGIVSDEEGWSMLLGLMVAGMDTTVNGIGSAIRLFIEHPQQWRRLREGDATAAQAWEEALRFESPVQMFFRDVTKPAEFADGVTIPEGARVAVMYGSANRDPRQFPSADEFDVTRGGNRHLAFGFGIHQCIGAPLARLEGQAVLTHLLIRVERFTSPAAAQRATNSVSRGYHSVPVTLHPA